MNAFVRLYNNHNNRPHIVRAPCVSVADASKVDDLFAEFFRGTAPAASARTPTMPLDVTETAEAYTISAALPGVRKDDIELLIDKNTVTIHTDIARAADNVEGTTLLHQERAYGKASRTISLETEIDEAKTNANYVDGVLTLMLKKKIPPQAKRININ